MPESPDAAADPTTQRETGCSPVGQRRPTARTRRLAARALLVAVPILLVAACGSGDESGGGQSSSGGSEQQEQKPASESAKIETWQVGSDERGSYDYGLGAWQHEDLVVHATTTDVLAVDVTSGEEAWRFEPPKVDGKPAEFCGASERIVDGKVALAYGVGGEPEPGVRRHCTDVMLFDLATHQPDFSESFVGGEDDVDSLSLPQQIAYVEPTGEDSVESVVVGYLRYLRAFDASGEEMWFNRLLPAEGSPSSASCSLNDLTTEGSQVAVLSSCNDAPSSVLTIDPSTEKVTRRARLESSAIGGELAAGGILRTDPTVLSVMLDDQTFEYLTIDDSGSVAQVIENPTDSATEQIDFSAKSSPDGARSYHRHAFGDDLLATVTVGNMASNKLMLYDLASGEQLWKKGRGIGWKFQPISVDDKGVTALAIGETDGVLQLVHAAADDGKLRTLQEVKVPSKVITPASSAVLFATEGRVIGADLDNRSSRNNAVLFSFPLDG